MSNNCTNPPADSLVAGTFIGTDCNGNEMGAGSTFASCSDINNLSTEVSSLGNEVKNLDFATHEEVNTVNQKAGTAQTAADNAQNTADTAETNAQKALEKTVVRVDADGDTRNIVLNDGTKIPFLVKDLPTEPTFQDQKVIGFGVKDDKVVITMVDGTEHKMTRQEFADWLAAQDTPLATDNELVEAIAQGTGVLQEQINTLNQGLDSLQAQIDTFDADQAMLFVRGDKLVLRNEDGTESEEPLTSLIPISPDSGNLLDKRDNGIYYGVQAPPNLANLYVDAELGEDGSIDDGFGTKDKPFKTLDYAMDITPQDKSNTIHLKATTQSGEVQRYSIRGNNTIKSGAKRRIASYDQPYLTDALLNCFRQELVESIRPANSTSWVRPIVEYDTWYLGYLNQQLFGRIRLEDASLIYSGVAIEIPTFEYPLNEVGVYGNYMHWGSGKVVLSSTDIIYNSESHGRFAWVSTGNEMSITGTAVEVISDVDITDSSLDGFISLDGGSTVLSVSDRVDSPFTYRHSDACGGEEYIEKKSANFLQYIKRTGAVYGIVRHSSGVPLNVISNFAI